MIDNKTPNLQLPLPNQQNLLSVDVERIIQAITMLDTAITNLKSELAAFQASSQAAMTTELSKKVDKTVMASELGAVRVLAMAGL